jgi:hypothetical protein
MGYNDGDDLTIFVGLGSGTVLVLWILSTFFEIAYVLLLTGAGIILVLSLLIYSNYSFKKFPRFGYYALGYVLITGFCVLFRSVYVAQHH